MDLENSKNVAFLESSGKTCCSKSALGLGSVLCQLLFGVKILPLRANRSLSVTWE